METLRILVTGGAGFLGSWLVDELTARGHEVTSVDNLLGGYMRNVNHDCQFIKADLRDRTKTNELAKGINVIFHAAAYAAEGQSFFSPIEINDINTSPMNNLLVAAVNHGVERFVFTSSMAVYGSQRPPFRETMPRRPDDPYGVGKAYCEMMLEIFARTYGFEYVVVRPHNVYGPRQNISDPYRNVLGIWINRILRNRPPLIFGDGKQTRAFSYIEDVTPAITNAGFVPRARNQTINVGTDEVASIAQACKIVLGVMGSKLEPLHEPVRPGEVKHAHCTIEKSVRLLKYKTKHTFPTGVRKMVEWARRIGPQEPSYTLPLEITKGAPKVWLRKSV